MESLGLSVRAEFVPFSQSRNAKPSARTAEMSLNWRVTLVKDGRDILTTNYSAGIAHCPSYKGGKMSVDTAEAIRRECETGRKYSDLGVKKTAPILPKSEDVIYSLIMDSDVLNYSNFEDWAGDMGYDSDSRKAESIYRACLEIALKLRNGLGESGLATLRNAFQDY